MDWIYVKKKYLVKDDKVFAVLRIVGDRANILRRGLNIIKISGNCASILIESVNYSLGGVMN